MTQNRGDESGLPPSPQARVFCSSRGEQFFCLKSHIGFGILMNGPARRCGELTPPKEDRKMT